MRTIDGTCRPVRDLVRARVDRLRGWSASAPVVLRATTIWWLLVDAFLDVVVGRACAGCQRPGRVLCVGCRDELQSCRPRTVERAGVPMVVSAARYRDLVARLLVAHKDRGALGLSRPLGAALASALMSTDSNAARGSPVVLVPVPSSRRSTRRRGYDHTRLLAVATARALRRAGVRATVVAVLRRSRPVSDQAELALESRATNQHGSMSVRRRRAARLDRPPGSVVVLVDDIVTTGATVREACRVLADHHRQVALVSAVADTPRRHPESARSQGESTCGNRAHLPNAPSGPG